jgi:hypothetical protein
VSNVLAPDGGYNYYNRSIEDLEDDIRSDAKAREEKREEALDTQAKRHEEDLRRQDEKYAEQIAKVRDDAYERIQSARQDARDEANETKKRTYDRYGRLYEQTQADREDARRSIQKAQDDYDTASARDRERRDHLSDQVYNDEIRREEDAADHLRDAHDDETARLRRQIQDLEEQPRMRQHGYAEGRAAAIRDMENEYRDQAKVNADATTAELNAVRERGRTASRYYSEQNDRNLKEQGLEMTHMLNQRTEEAHQDRRMLENEMQLDHDQSELRARKNREYSQRQLENRMAEADEDRDHALQAQGDAWKQSYENMSQADSEKIARLEASLQEARTSEDVNQISPAAEEAVRRQMAREMDNTNTADQKRRSDENEALRRGFNDRYNQLLSDKQRNETRMAQDRALQQHQDQAAYIDSVTELSNDRDETIRSKEANHQRATDTLTHDHARALEQQRRDYEDVIKDLKDDANSRMAATRQDNEFNAKMTQKAFSARQNELIREYEKKLADQKAEYESQLGDVKTELANTQREFDRRTRQSLDQQSKGYEQRIAQMEQANKERERLVSENYQDELEKVKRSNALLIQKKS